MNQLKITLTANERLIPLKAISPVHMVIVL